MSMRMLAEMAIARPASGSWSEYAHEAHGPWAGFISGSLYWYLWIVTIAFETTAGASIIDQWVTISIAYLSPGSVFVFLTTSIGAIIVIDHVIIAATHIRLRRRLERDGHPPPGLRMWMFPWLSYATLVALLTILVSMAFLDDLRKQLFYSLASVAAIAAAWILRQRLPR